MSRPKGLGMEAAFNGARLLDRRTVSAVSLCWLKKTKQQWVGQGARRNQHIKDCANQRPRKRYLAAPL